eukprot:15365354-Ditylum_brightwellii.AAC.2
MQSANISNITGASIYHIFHSTSTKYDRKGYVAHLSSNIVPTSLKQYHDILWTDKSIWDMLYSKEYYNPHNGTRTWDDITEEEHQLLKLITGHALPIIDLAAIKHNKHGNLHQAKYYICVLENLHPHDWAKPQWFASVMSQLEMHLLVTTAVYFNKTVKNGDFKQAFCQSYLPENKNNILCPPKDCPLTPSNTYLKPIQTLHGLKHSP